MPRIRSMKPEMLADEKLAPMAVIDRFVFAALILLADDAGRLVDNVKTIDGAVFPETDESARESLERLAAAGRIRRYVSASGQKLLQLTNWKRHQKVDNPSKYVLPAPAEPPEPAATTSSDNTEETAASYRDSRETLGSFSRSDLDLGAGSRTEDRGAGAGAARASARATTPPAPLSSTPLDLPAPLAPIEPTLRQMQRERYADASPGRWGDVVRQLGAVAAGGLLARKKPRWFVQASLEVLERAIRAALAEPIDDPDATIVVVLLKCTSGPAVTPTDDEGRLPSEALAAAQRATEAADDREFAERRAQVAAWCAAHPAERLAFEAAAVAEFADGMLPGAVLERARVARVAELVEQRAAELHEPVGVP